MAHPERRNGSIREQQRHHHMTNFQIQSILSQNITLVYAALDLEAIDSNAIRHLVGAPAEQMLFASDRIHVAYPPPGTLLVQIAENRFVVIQKDPANDIVASPFFEITWKCNLLIPGAGPKAYGFNYDVDLALAGGNAQTALNQLVAPDARQIEQVLAGWLRSAFFTS